MLAASLAPRAAVAVAPPPDAAGVLAYGSFWTSREGIAVANAAGVRAAQLRTSSQLLTVPMSPDGGTGYAEATATDVTTIDAAALGREAAEKARATEHRVSPEPGDYAGVLAENPVIDIAATPGYLGFAALAVQ